MTKKFLHTICCSSCGKVLSKSYPGTESFTTCPKCGAELYYKVSSSGPTISIVKEPSKPPPIPAVPA